MTRPPLPDAVAVAAPRGPDDAAVASAGASPVATTASPDVPWTIEAIDLVKRYGDVAALDGLTLRVGRGEIFGFLGPNGAGKTTTIRILTGLLQPTSGIARICGHDLATEPIAARQSLSFIPDTPYLYEKLTGREFIHFVAGLYRTPPDVATRRMDELLAVFDLADRADDLIEGYSHGMRQKTLMIAALVHDPEVLFLDEPTVGLDPRSAKLMRDVYRQLAARGTTIFLSTHILEIAERMCDRIGIVEGGQLVALGTMDELRRLAAQNETLEDIFLELTGGAAYAEIAQVLA